MITPRVSRTDATFGSGSLRMPGSQMGKESPSVPRRTSMLGRGTGRQAARTSRGERMAGI